MNKETSMSVFALFFSEVSWAVDPFVLLMMGGESADFDPLMAGGITVAFAAVGYLRVLTLFMKPWAISEEVK